MSKLFFDHLIVFEEVNVVIKNAAKDPDEREELWKVVDEMVQHNVLTCILEKLPDEHHSDFLEKYHAFPYDTGIIDFLNEKTEEDIEGIIRARISDLEKEILEEILGE